ncbi:DegT/DnrJ/EryC1/StrS family aminotransferase [Pseudomonas sp. P7759]|uniref:DegT/DnrJ/EryC1/StrS family aminotransferase n=1 Tax=Pseudomonas sp. P7759 TaxID=2738831 RepID=UPI0015A393A7|nr:DegT/DnrJ/EryC1/StrS family aminotransferase [Pseudomonas sp. P7759]NWC77468.1 DegT/DnrJ/EryC1/StrS family aminotransferase [Pseudomonas sp. P7759]
MIRCNDVQEQAQDLTEAFFEQWRNVLSAGDFILGEEVTRFETWLSGRCNGAHVVSMNSGTDALILAMRAVGVSAGDEVITCANTFIATVGAIVAVGAYPVLADVEEDELISLQTIEPLLSDRTKAVVTVHLRGRPVDMVPITAACRARDIAVIEDCAQAIGTLIEGRQVGTFGDAAAFSFHPLKTLGGLGDGGALVTTSTKIAEYARGLRNHGLRSRDEAFSFGLNTRLDALQAVALNIKTEYLDLWLQRRRAIATYYDAVLADTATGSDLGRGKAGSAYYHYVVRSQRRNELQQYLAHKGIQAAVHYPTPIHCQRAWLDSRSAVALPVTERLAKEILTLPCHPHLSDSDVEKIAVAIRDFDLK